LIADGFDPLRVAELYMDDRSNRRYVPLDAATHARLTTGDLRI
jgi:hypothetical protein